MCSKSVFISIQRIVPGRTMWNTYRSGVFIIGFLFLLPYVSFGKKLEFSVPHTAKLGRQIGSLEFLEGSKYSSCALDKSKGPLDATRYFNVTSLGHIYTVASVSTLLNQHLGISVKCESGEKSGSYFSEHAINFHIDNGHSSLIFSSSNYEGHIGENLPSKTVVEGLENLFATTDLFSSTSIEYSIISGARKTFKLVKHQEGIISIVSLKHLNREKIGFYVLQIKACLHPCWASVVTNVTIHVDDVNDNTPYFEKSDYYTSISQDIPALSTVYYIEAIDLDIDKLVYSAKPDDIFSIDPSLGHVILNPDVELKSPVYDISIQATDLEGKTSNKTSLHIQVDDVLRFNPRIIGSRSKRSIHAIKEVQMPESYIDVLVRIHRSVHDRFKFKEPFPDMLEIDEVTGYVRLKGGYKLDYETEPIIEFTVVITKMNDLSYLQEETVRIKLIDENDEVPFFVNEPRPFLATVSQNAGPGTSVYHLIARDLDQNSEVQYNLESGGEDRFEVDGHSGVVRTKGTQPFRWGKEYEIGVSATDVNADNVQKSPTHSLKILVGEREPQFCELLYKAKVSEAAEQQKEIVNIKAYSFQGFPITYALLTESGNTQQEFAINSKTGVVDLLKKLDYETDPDQYHIKVQATENGQVVRTSTVNLQVSLVDENDNNPMFPLSQYIVTGIPETVAMGTDIIQVMATDLDSVTNAQLTYTVSDDKFTVESFNNMGFIKTARRLDYDFIPDHTYNFTVTATDNGTPARNGMATVRVGVTNINDESPVFPQSIEHIQVSEDAHNTVVHVVQAYDPDGDDVTYTFAGGSLDEGPFRIDSKTGIITLRGYMNRDRVSYKLNITAKDDGKCCGGTQSRESRGQVIIEVKDINNNAPIFPDCSEYHPEVDEMQRVGTPVIRVRAIDPDRGANGNISYSVVKSGDQSSEWFAIDSVTGQVRTANVFDRESKTGVTDLGLTIKAVDHGSPRLAGFCTFTVKIGDMNDNPPVFDLAFYSIAIDESTLIGKKVLQVYATDRDAGENGQVEYNIAHDPSNGFFRIEPNTGWIKVARAMSGRDQVRLRVRAQDRGVPFKMTGVDVLIDIQKQMNSFPQWLEDYSSTPIRLSENAPRDYVVKRLQAVSDNMNSRHVNYVIQAGETPDQNGPPESFHSRIDEETNEMILMVYKSLDYEVINTYTLNIKAANRATNSIHNDTRITIQLIDENDEIPMFVGLDENGRYSGSVPENSPHGTVVIRVTATDRDAFPDYSRVTYRLKTIYDHEKFAVDPHTGQITTTARFDREQKSEYYIMVMAQDGAKSDRPNHYPPGTPNQGEVEVQIRVTDKNDERPYFKQFLYTASVPENADPGSVIITVTAEDKDEENTLSYSIPEGNLGNVFEVDSVLGQIKVRGKLDYEQGPKEFRLKYRVFDEKFDNTTIVIIYVTDVNDNPPHFLKNVYNFTDLVEEDDAIRPNNRKHLLTVKAEDPDTDRDSNIRYSLTGQFHDDGTFEIDPYSGHIYLTRKLDRDKPQGRPIWNFNVLAHDEPGTESSLTGYAEVRVMPHDINDNVPEFNRNFLVGRVKEHSGAGTPVLTVMAEDKDAGNNGTVTYTLKQSPVRDGMPLFSIDRDSGLISTTMSNTLDREVKAVYDRIIVQAKDKGISPYQQSASATVTILVEDINDHAPQFTQKVYKATMSEDLALDSSVTSVSATDADIGINAKLMYTLKEDDRSYFSMMSVQATNTGVLKVFKKPDFDALRSPTFNLTVYVTDTDSSHVDVAYIEVNVTDANDNAPMFLPTNVPVSVFENVSLGISLARFKARDIDTGMNGQFRFSIDRRSDPEQLYNINSGGLVTVAKPLNREAERGSTHRVRILAIDKGFPPQTGVGTLQVTLLDVNDNYPKFKDDYRPVIYENQARGISVVTIHAIDDDTLANGPPFTFSTPHCRRCPCPENPSCHAFEFIFRPDAGPNRYGEGEVISKMTFDREKQKEYYLPIIMKDHGNPRMSGTNTLTIIIGDINDNVHYAGHKDVFIYNYRGDFSDIYLGRVYAEDEDDWDITDKTFKFLSQETNNLFRLNTETGELFTNGKIAVGDFTFSVQVYDINWDREVTSTVTVHVQEIGDDAVYSSGSLRLIDITAEEFVAREPSPSKPRAFKKSKYDLFREKLAKKLNIPTLNVDIFTVMNHPTLARTVDIRFSAHNSPYYKPVLLDGIISANLDEFSRAIGLQISMVPIDECLKETCEAGCSNTLVTTGDPMVINTNGSSLVGVTAYIKAECVCAARDFSENVTTCEHPYSCLNGGRCIQREHDYVCSCSSGYSGARCQQTHRTFRGNGWAWFKPLAQCEESHTSLEFITTSVHGVLFYNGPLGNKQSNVPNDFIWLELKHGYPVLRIDHGSGEARLALDGRDTQGLKQVQPLNDGKWHRLDIFRNGKEMKLVVDKCQKSQIVENENAQTSFEDRRPCEVSGQTPGDNRFINVNTPLQLGGFTGRPYTVRDVPHMFKGCIRNFMHNGELYDLHIGTTGQQSNSEDGCIAEDSKCGLNSIDGPVCGENSICEANFNDNMVRCTCKPGFRGPKCSMPSTVKDFHTDSFIEWDFKDSFYEDNVDFFHHMTDIQLMFRTRQPSGMLFIAQNTHKSEYMVLEVESMRVQFRYNLGSGEQLLQLAYVNVSEGNWHTVQMSRVGQWVTLTLDQADGRYYNYSVGGPDSHRNIRVSQRSVLAGGNVRFSSSNTIVLVNDDYSDSCMNDIRYNGVWLPMDTSQNMESLAADVIRSDNLDDTCESIACSFLTCIPPFKCIDMWRYAECGCPPGKIEQDGFCVNKNECLQRPCIQGACIDTEIGFHCKCFPGYEGELCGLARSESPFVDLSMGAILAIIICALVLLLVILLFVIYTRRRKPDSYTLGVDPDDDVRENIIHYNEEGVGEEDQDAYDISRLKKPMSESPPVRKSMPPPSYITLHKSGPPPQKAGPVPPSSINDFVKNRIKDADTDPSHPPHDSVREYAYEGGGSDAGSLSSLASTTDPDDQDFDYLSNWGPRFNKLADMYGGHKH